MFDTRNGHGTRAQVRGGISCAADSSLGCAEAHRHGKR
jgi:hypothetical protein